MRIASHELTIRRSSPTTTTESSRLYVVCGRHTCSHTSRCAFCIRRFAHMSERESTQVKGRQSLPSREARLAMLTDERILTGLVMPCKSFSLRESLINLVEKLTGTLVPVKIFLWSSGEISGVPQQSSGRLTRRVNVWAQRSHANGFAELIRLMLIGPFCELRSAST
jgi:hypothetical protein